MKAILIASLAMLAGCSRNPDTGNTTNSIDVGNAASAAQRDIDNYAAATPAGSGAATGGSGETSAPTVPADASPPIAGTPPSLPETPVTAENAQGAANVIQTYYALLESGRYRQAWRLWDGGGKASGMTADAFAASFAKYREYHANVGAPGRVDAGAGQRYVTVPVKVYGKLKAGNRPFTMRGPVTLHRTAQIDGATAEQRMWRISASGVRPRQ